MTRANDEVVRRFLDGELSAEAERRALHGIAEDPDSRALLRFDARVRSLIAEEAAERGAVPAGFTDRVMAAIEARETAPAGRTETTSAGAAPALSGEDRAGRLGWLWNELTRPRTLVWRPAYAVATVAAAALALALVLGPLGPGSGGDGGAPPGTSDEGAVVATASPASTASPAATGEAAGAEEVLVRFVFADGAAESVAVAGDFSHWEPIPLRRRDSDGGALWTAVVAVPRGEHRYMFVLDGERWVTDPLATAARDDGFGNRNAILSL